MHLICSAKIFTITAPVNYTNHCITWLLLPHPSLAITPFTRLQIYIVHNPVHNPAYSRSIKYRFTHKMPLLSLPYEILLEIIEAVHTSARPFSLAGHNSNTVHLAQTCQILRSLSTPYVYSSITLHNHICAHQVQELLELYPSVASHVRSLKLSAFDEPYRQPLRDVQFWDILSRCKKLQELRFDENTVGGKFDKSLLVGLAPESRGSLRMIQFIGVDLDTVLRNFKFMLRSGEFGGLEIIEITAPHVSSPEMEPQVWRRPIPAASGTRTSKKLESVRKFYFKELLEPILDSPAHVPLGVGSYFAQAMPNLNVLSMMRRPCIINETLFTYAELGSHLTELTLHLDETSESSELCKTLSRLSPKLTFLSLRGLGVMICHKLFAASWAKIGILKIESSSMCNGTKPDLLCAHLKEIVETHPTARVSLNQSYVRLASWRYGGWTAAGERIIEHFFASPEVFRGFGPMYVNYGPDNDSGEGNDEDGDGFDGFDGFDGDDDDDDERELQYEEDLGEDHLIEHYDEGEETDPLQSVEQFASQTSGPSGGDMLAFLGISAPHTD